MKTIYVDGSLRKIAVVVGNKTFITYLTIDEAQTTNQAEYLAILAGAAVAKSLGIKDYKIVSDSLLAVNQITGVYDVRNAKLCSYKELILVDFPEIATRLWWERRNNPAGVMLD